MADMEFETAPEIKEALKKLVDETVLGYTHPTPGYYQALTDWMKRRHDFPIKQEWVVNTPGVVYALGMLIDASTKPADNVIVLTPVYYPFDMAVIAKGRHIVYSPLVIRNGRYEIDYEDLEKKAKSEKTKALLFCNPHNPVGRVWEPQELAQVGEICCKNNVFIIDDEIHHDLIMPGYHHTVMANISDEIHENIAVCTAPSKTFNLAGVQCSNIIIPNESVRARAKAYNMMQMQSGMNIFAHRACEAAYSQGEPWLEELLTVIADNARYVEEYMAQHWPQIKVYPLEGTYLQWLDMRGLEMNHRELKQMLEEAGIYLDNGEIFGHQGRGFERINLACARSTLEVTMDRFTAAVEKVQQEQKEHGKPYHKNLACGDILEHFQYDSCHGTGIDLKQNITRPTLIVFSRFYDCPVTQLTLKMMKGMQPLLSSLGYDMKFVMQTKVEQLAPHQKDYPFELIGDPYGRLYDNYNIFEADTMVQMLAGDKLFETYLGKNVGKILYSPLVDMIGGALDAKPQEEEKEVQPRGNQMSAFVLVYPNMKVRNAYYSKTIGDIPNIMMFLKGKNRRK